MSAGHWTRTGSETLTNNLSAGVHKYFIILRKISVLHETEMLTMLTMLTVKQ